MEILANRSQNHQSAKINSPPKFPAIRYGKQEVVWLPCGTGSFDTGGGNEQAYCECCMCSEIHLPLYKHIISLYFWCHSIYTVYLVGKNFFA